MLGYNDLFGKKGAAREPMLRDKQAARAKSVFETLVVLDRRDATFYRAGRPEHVDFIAGANLFTSEVWTVRGLVRFYTLLLIEIATRRVHVAGTKANPTVNRAAPQGQGRVDVTQRLGGMLHFYHRRAA